mmetsp:Transcript_48371/g.129458  ORF Transcript_48371/g.129458 Transcript_48371/m.129458 type:complete len:258 (-) Transcript_48371:383-1156(-)
MFSPILTHSISSFEPRSPSKSVWATRTVSRHVLFRVSFSDNSTVVEAVQPGSLQRNLEPRRGGGGVGLLQMSVLVGICVLSQLGWTKHFTTATPLNRFPFTGHSSTMRDILAVIFSFPSRFKMPSSERSFRQGIKASSPLAPQVRVGASGWQWKLNCFPFSCTSSTYSRLYSSSKSVGCTRRLNLQSACSVAWSKTCKVAVTSHPAFLQAIVVFRLCSENSMYLCLEFFLGNLPRPKASYCETELSNQAGSLAFVIV